MTVAILGAKNGKETELLLEDVGEFAVLHASAMGHGRRGRKRR
ncbi:MAG: hypothetical protein NTZ90_00875 [Proteobacteria bacterium]|nr:hypothetical protein [Pseudomonadota bacterium]